MVIMVSNYLTKFKVIQSLNISTSLIKNNFRRCVSTVSKDTNVSSTTHDAGNFSTGESIQPIKMAYTSYETTILEDQPNAVPIIIMHGLMGSKGNWNSLSKAIHSRTKLKVLAVDARNHGDSAHTSEMTYPHLAEDVRALMYDLRIEKATLMGHSMGGRAMMTMALRYPELVERLIVVDISPVGSSPSLFLMPRYFDAMDNVKIKAHIPISSARESADAQLAKVIPDKGVRQFILTNLISAEDGRFKWRINLAAVAKNFINIAKFPPVGNASFNRPTLFIKGALSDYIKATDMAEILKLFPKAQLETIANAGHWVHSEKPNDFLNIVTKFLKEEPSKLELE